MASLLIAECEITSHWQTEQMGSMNYPHNWALRGTQDTLVSVCPTNLSLMAAQRKAKPIFTS